MDEAKLVPRDGHLKQNGQMRRPQLYESPCEGLAQGVHRVQHLVKSTVKCAYQGYKVVEDIAALLALVAEEKSDLGRRHLNRCRAERASVMPRPTDLPSRRLWPTCAYTYRGPPSQHLAITAHHTPHISTALSQWPPNVSPTCSPTSPPARLLSSRCMHSEPLPTSFPRLDHMRNVPVWLTDCLEQHLPEPRRCCYHTRHPHTSN
jgi:hypothetical protein